MKHYFFNDGTEESKYDSVLRDFEHGIEMKILVSSPMSFETANKVAALGQPIVLQANFWKQGRMADAASKVLENSPECVIAEFDVNEDNINQLEEILCEIENDPKLFGLKVRLTENELNSNDVPLSDALWNTLIVRCYDHNIDLCWTGNAASYRYSGYLESIA